MITLLLTHARLRGAVCLGLAVACVYFSFLSNAVAQESVVKTYPPLRVEPMSVEFPNMQTEHAIKVYLGEILADQAQITRAAIEPSYARMFSISRPYDSPGTLILRLNREQAEVGSYILFVEAGGQQAQVAVRVSLSEHKDIVEMESSAGKEDPQNTRLRMGLATRLWRESLTLSLSEPMYEGSILQVELPPHPSRTFTWYINGEAVHAGTGINTFSQPLVTLGPLSVGVKITERGRTVAESSAKTTVVAEPVVAYTAKAGKAFRLAGPAEYARYAWRIDSQLHSDESIATFRFDKPGQYLVECRADQPANDPSRAFRRIVWEVVVK